MSLKVLIPYERDPELLEQLYERFAYLRDHPLKLRGVPDATSAGIIGVQDLLLVVLADTDTRLPYRPDFDFLTPQENDKLTGYCQFQPALPCPQPILGLYRSADGALSSGEVCEVEVLMQPSGSAQLWWGGSIGVIFEAFVSERVRQGQEHLVMNALWDRCEAFLHMRGVTKVWTHQADLEFASYSDVARQSWYAALLAARGYCGDEAENRVNVVGKARL